MRFLIVVFLVGLLGACSGNPNLNDPVLSERELNLEEFFDGRSTAYGQFQDIFGTVQRRFIVEVKGSFDGRTLKLVEDFVYDDGVTEQRVWTLVKTGDQTWSGMALGVIGTASGEERGDTFNWKYKIDLPVKQGTMRVEFDDWMWLLTDARYRCGDAYVRERDGRRKKAHLLGCALLKPKWGTGCQLALRRRGITASPTRAAIRSGRVAGIGTAARVKRA